MEDFAFVIGDERYDLYDVLSLNRVAGIVVIHGGVVRFEQYLLGNAPDTRWMSMSVVKSITATVSVKRDASFAEEVAITVAGLPANVKATPMNIPKGANEVKVKFDAAANAAPGTFPITFGGKAKTAKGELSGATSPVSLVIKK